MDSKRHFNKRASGPRVVGAPRNEFGTRLCQRISCDKCHKVDYVPLRLNGAKAALCRDCAERLLDTYDQGRHIEEKKVTRSCEQCHRDFKVAEAVTKKKEQLLCSDCYRGFEVWRGKPTANNKPSVRTRPVLTRSGSRTTFRKHTDDAV